MNWFILDVGRSLELRTLAGRLSAKLNCCVSGRFTRIWLTGLVLRGKGYNYFWKKLLGELEWNCSFKPLSVFVSAGVIEKCCG